MMRSLPGAWRRHPRITAAVSALAVLLLAAGVTSAVAVHRLQGNIRTVDVTAAQKMTAKTQTFTAEAQAPR